MKSRLGSPSNWFRSKIVDPFLLILRRGIEPRQLAISASLGITIGIFPICGVTFFLCGFAAAVLRSRCHTPTLMLANFVATPLELSLIVPFLRVGEWILDSEHLEFSSDALKQIVTGHASRDVLLGFFHVIFGWIITAPLIFGILYIIFYPIFLISLRKVGSDHPRPLPTHRTGIRVGEISPKKALA